jgi:hypothetical protein
MSTEYTAFASLTILLVFVVAALVRQRQAMKASTTALNRQQESLELLRESVRLVRMIAKSLERP